MWNFLKDPWHVKYLATIFVVIVGMINGFAPEGPYNFAGVQDLKYTDGVKAAMFALCTAIFLFIQQIPWWGEQDPVATIRGDKVLMVLVAASTVVTGWYWLRDASEGIAWPFAVMVAIAASTIVVPAAIHAAISFRSSPSLPTAVPTSELAPASLEELRTAIGRAQAQAQQVVNETYGPAHDDLHPDRTQAGRSWSAARECRDKLTESAEAAGRIIE